MDNGTATGASARTRTPDTASASAQTSGAVAGSDTKHDGPTRVPAGVPLCCQDSQNQPVPDCILERPGLQVLLKGKPCREFLYSSEVARSR